MIRKIIFGIFLIALLIAIVAGYKFFTGKTGFTDNHKYLYIYTKKATRGAVMDAIRKDSIVVNAWDFEFLASRFYYWEKIKPGRYLIKKGESVYDIVTKLRRGDDFPVRLIINKLRLNTDFAKLVGKNFETDSSSIMDYLDSSRQQLFYKIIPNTYFMPWTYQPNKILEKLNNEYDSWWQRKARIQRAQEMGFTPSKIYTIASIVEEETNVPEDKKLIASVYFNRLEKNMPLQADPTIRYALKNFGMNRVLYADLSVNSPYNTYLYTGLPPGPICTPSQATIDSVLQAPKTDYLFFVANADLMGGSTFNSNYAGHSKAARVYQDSLTAWQKRKAIKQNAINDSIAKAKNGL